jgi:hypothetical protein
MRRNACVFCSLLFALAVFSGCSSKPSADQAKTAPKLDKIQGKAQLLIESGTLESALNAGGQSIYLWEGARRYRLFIKAPVQVTHGDQYVVEGIYAQKMIDDIGDPDNGANGYPLLSSCEKAVRRVWSGIPMDQIDLHAQTLKARVNRYPARAVFLVSKIAPATESSTDSAGLKKKEDAEKGAKLKEVSVPPEKQRALLAEGSTTLPAPLWEPKGGTVSCPVLIDTEGKIESLLTGKQLCEAVDWGNFRFQAPGQAGKPIKVNTEVEVKFEPRK